MESEWHVKLQQTHQRQNHQFIQNDTHYKPAANTDKSYDNDFPEHHFANMAFFHTQNIEQAKFFLAAFHEETVRIE